MKVVVRSLITVQVGAADQQRDGWARPGLAGTDGVHHGVLAGPQDITAVGANHLEVVLAR